IRDRNVTGVQTCALPIWTLRWGRWGENPQSAGESSGFQEKLTRKPTREQNDCCSSDGHILRACGRSGRAEGGHQTGRRGVAYYRSEERRVGKECRLRWST